VFQDKNQDNTKLQDKSLEEMTGEEVLILAEVSDQVVALAVAQVLAVVSDQVVALAEAQVLEEVSDQEVLDKK